MAEKKRKPVFGKVVTGGVGFTRGGRRVEFPERDVTNPRKAGTRKRKSA